MEDCKLDPHINISLKFRLNLSVKKMNSSACTKTWTLKNYRGPLLNSEQIYMILLELKSKIFNYKSPKLKLDQAIRANHIK